MPWVRMRPLNSGTPRDSERPSVATTRRRARSTYGAPNACVNCLRMLMRRLGCAESPGPVRRDGHSRLLRGTGLGTVDGQLHNIAVAFRNVYAPV